MQRRKTKKTSTTPSIVWITGNGSELCQHVATAEHSTGGEKTIHGLFHSHNHNDEPVFSTAVLCIYLVGYWILAVITYGVKVPSGLFVPGIIVGATFGRVSKRLPSPRPGQPLTHPAPLLPPRSLWAKR